MENLFSSLLFTLCFPSLSAAVDLCFFNKILTYMKCDKFSTCVLIYLMIILWSCKKEDCSLP